MIQINHKENCCGCEACVQVCPVHCISYNADKEGFYYPSADNKLCIHCNLCEKVCPVSFPDLSRRFIFFISYISRRFT